jgi:hypothetical protein
MPCIAGKTLSIDTYNPPFPLFRLHTLIHPLIVYRLITHSRLGSRASLLKKILHVSIDRGLLMDTVAARPRLGFGAVMA